MLRILLGGFWVLGQSELAHDNGLVQVISPFSRSDPGSLNPVSGSVCWKRSRPFARLVDSKQLGHHHTGYGPRTSFGSGPSSKPPHSAQSTSCLCSLRTTRYVLHTLNPPRTSCVHVLDPKVGNPKARNSPKALYNMVLGPKT